MDTHRSTNRVVECKMTKIGETMRRTFCYTDEKSNKFWAIQTNGGEFTVTFGKTGTAGQSQTKSFANEAACKKEAEKLIREKTKKGYVEQEDETPAAQKIQKIADKKERQKDIKSLKENGYDYYLIFEKNSDATPLLMNDDNENILGIAYLSKCQQVPTEHITYLTFRGTFKGKPDLNTDCLGMDTSGVFSKKIFDALSQRKIKGLQLVPVIIRGKKNELYKDFYIANVYQEIYSFDKEKTEFSRISEWNGEWSMIEKIVLDKELLSKIPLEDRLVYVSKEHPQFVLYHKSVIDIILSVEPKGLKCVPVEEWNDELLLEDEDDDDDDD